VEKADLAGGVLLALLGVLLIFVVIPLDTEEGMYFGLPPTFFPTLLSVGLTLLAVALAAKAWIRLRAGGPRQPAPLRLRNLLMFGISGALVVAGAVIIDFFGMIAGGPLLIAVLMLFLGERNVLRILATATLPVAAVYLLATYVLQAPLP
jgi:hypothetical protein